MRIPFNGTIIKQGLIGAYVVNDTALHSFDFNLTFEEDIHL
jgi:hypothetical protein